MHKLCGGSFCVHDEVKNKISAEHAQSETEGISNQLLEETRKYMNHLGEYDVIVIGAGHNDIILS